MKFSETTPTAMTAQVLQIVNTQAAVVVYHGQILKVRVLQSIGTPLVGDTVILEYLRDSGEFYIATGGDVPTGTGGSTPCVNPPYPVPVPSTDLYFWVSVPMVNPSIGSISTNPDPPIQGMRRLRVTGDTLAVLHSRPLVDLGYNIIAVRSVLSDPDVCYALTLDSDTLRVHKTVDGGATWSVTWSLNPMGGRTVNPEAFFVNQADPDRVYFGTYDTNASLSATVLDSWLYGSTDGGDNFTYLSEGITVDAEYRTAYTYNPERGIRGVHETEDFATLWTFHDPVWFDAEAPPYYHWSKSTDGGATFVANCDLNSESTQSNYASSAMSPDGSMLCGIRMTPGGNTYAYPSNDSGATWNPWGGWSIPDLPPPPVVSNEAAATPDIASNNMEISRVDTEFWIVNGPLAGHHDVVWRSLDFGATWGDLNWPIASDASKGPYYGTNVFCDLSNADGIWVLGRGLIGYEEGLGHQSQFYYSTILYTPDRGVTWAFIWSGDFEVGPDQIYIAGQSYGVSAYE